MINASFSVIDHVIMQIYVFAEVVEYSMKYYVKITQSN